MMMIRCYLLIEMDFIVLDEMISDEKYVIFNFEYLT